MKICRCFLLPFYDMFLPCAKSINLYPSFSGVVLAQSGWIVYVSASFGMFPSGKHTSNGMGGFRMNLDPPGMTGFVYGSGWLYANISSSASRINLLARSGLHPRSASNRARIFVHSSFTMSRSIAQLAANLRDWRYNRAT